MKKKPLISIIITYYKKKFFIEKTIKSILDQTYKNYEVIFVYDDDDRSDLNFIKQILIKVKNKKIIINKKNLGVAKSRNIAMKHSKGQYLAFIDSDDIWKKNKLSLQVEFMIKNSRNFSFTSYDVINEKDMVISKRKVFKDIEYKELYLSNIIGLSTVMAHKKLLPKLKFPNLNTQEDFAVWLKLSRNGEKLSHIQQTLSNWRKTKNSLSSNLFKKLKDAFKLYYIYEKKNFILSVFSVVILSYKKIVKNFN